jgi:hypothetical protein
MLTTAIQSYCIHMEFVGAANCLLGWFPSRFTYQMLRIEIEYEYLMLRTKIRSILTGKD